MLRLSQVAPDNPAQVARSRISFAVGLARPQLAPYHMVFEGTRNTLLLHLIEGDAGSAFSIETAAHLCPSWHRGGILPKVGV